jgi:hypothetical protein
MFTDIRLMISGHHSYQSKNASKLSEKIPQSGLHCDIGIGGRTIGLAVTDYKLEK